MQHKPNLFTDVDGTLLDVTARHYEVYLRVMKSSGEEPLSPQAYWEKKRSPQPTLSSDVYGEHFREMIEDPALLVRDVPYPHCHEVLEILTKDWDIHLVTKRQFSEHLTQQLRDLHLISFFTSILSGNTKHKEELILQKFSPPVSGVMVGDTEVDIACGNALGLPTIAATYGFRSEAYLKQFHPTTFLTSLKNLPIQVDKFSKK